MKYLTIGTLWKDEHAYAEDFLTYHRKVGVEHFIIFDREYYKLYEMIGHYSDVEIIHFPEVPGNNHMEAWGQLIKLAQNKTKWLALIDNDMALAGQQETDIKNILKNYEDFACLQINWRTFGSSFKELKEFGSIYERFLLTAEDNCIYNTHTQFICDPLKVLPIATEEPHYPHLKDGEISVNTNKQEISNIQENSLNPNKPRIFNSPPLHDVLWVAHYTNKSKEEFLFKNSKGRADIPGAKMPLNQFEEYDSLCNVKQELRVLDIWKLK